MKARIMTGMWILLASSAAWVYAAGSQPSGASRPLPSAFTRPTDTPGTPARGPQSAPASRPVPAGMRKIDTPHYTLFTDVTPDDALEAQLRMTRMFEEYQRRTAGFATGQIKEKFPFYLFRNKPDYYAAGGPQKSAGVYIESHDGSKKLMAIAGQRTTEYTWSVVQHEGFHQFAAATIKAELPIWVNEGLAEYFGEAQWTGDGFVSGLIPQSRLEAVRAGIKRGFKPFKILMKLTPEEWADNLTEENYDEAWSMIHFLANADNGRYQGPFLKFMTQVSKGVEGQKAWEDAFGKETDAFQASYAKWWLALPDDPSREGYIKVMVQTYTSFLARAAILKQPVPSVENFLTSYQPPEVRVGVDLWLPPSLLTPYLDVAPLMGQWTYTGGTSPRLALQMRDGTTFTGTFSINAGKVTRVGVDVVTPPSRSGK